MNFKKSPFSATLGITLLFIAGFTPLLTRGATVEDFLGFWEIQEPAGDTCVVIIKRGGRISCFWSGSANNQIQQGKWVIEDERLVTTWDSGFIDIFEKMGTNAISRSSYKSVSALDKPSTLSVRGVRVDNRIPGSLTTQSNDFIPRDKTEAEETLPQTTPNIPMQNPFAGYWKLKQSTGIFGIGGASSEFFYLNLERNGSASTALRNWDGPESLRGSWTIQDGKALITWKNGMKDILEESAGTYVLKSFSKKKNFSDKPSDSRSAEKVTPSEGQAYFNAGNLQRLTVTDIRGTWTMKTPGATRETIDIEGWGNAYRSPSQINSSGADPGKWRLNNDRVIITWVDGSKDVIRLASPSFIRESYAPGEPVTGVPLATREVIRVEETL